MICKNCKEEKDIEEFPKHSGCIGGRGKTCKKCKTRNRKSRAGDPKVSNYNRLYQKRNSRELTQRYFTRNYRKAQLERYYSKREEILEKQRGYLKTPQGRSKNASKEGRRRARKLNATPTWLSQEQLSQIEYLYWLSKDLELTSGQKYHVDHIVPLQGRHVCGLHVPWNLQVIPAEINLSKGNKYDYEH